MPDQIWIADWDGKANTSSSYIRSGGWQPYGRMKQYRGGHTETWGGVRINIDRNYLNLRTPRLPGVAPAPTPAPAGPRYTGTSMSDPRCTPRSINRSSYRKTGARTASRPDRPAAVPAQAAARCTRTRSPARWNTADARRPCAASSAGSDHPVRSYVTRGDWVSLLASGQHRDRAAGRGRRGTDVIRVQRALNAARLPGHPDHRHLRHPHGQRRGHLPAQGRDPLHQGGRRHRPGRALGQGRPE